MPPSRLSFVFAGLALLTAGCDRPQDPPAPEAPATAALAPERAPDVAWQTEAGETSLAAYAGHPVVLHFAASASPSWSALEEAYPDLSAAGATILGIVTDDGTRPDAPFETAHADALAASFDATDAPTAILVDAEGWVRGRTEATDADALFTLAAPLLLEGPTGSSRPVATPSASRLDADGLDRLVRSGAALIDLRTDAERDTHGWVPYALPCPIERLSADQLPADLSTTLVLIGPEAENASAQAEAWGYTSVVHLPDAAPYIDAALAPSVPEPLDSETPLTPLTPLSRPPTVRG